MEPNSQDEALEMERRQEVEKEREREEKTQSPLFGEREKDAVGRETSGCGSAAEPMRPIKSLTKGGILGGRG